MLSALRFAFNLWIVVGYVTVAIVFGWWLMLVVPLIAAGVVIVSAFVWSRLNGE